MAKKPAKKKTAAAKKPAAPKRAAPKGEPAPVDPIAEALRRRRAALLAR
jgi:hypothetical protein